MTNPNQPNAPEPGDRDVEARFDDLISSMPELSALTRYEVGDALEAVTIVVPNPGNAGHPLQLVMQVPAEIAPALRAEFSPDRIAAMVQAITAVASLTMPPPQT